MPLRVAIVGCGKIADGHVEEIQKMPERAQVTAVCDRELLIAEQLSMRYRVPAHYDNFSELLDREKPDVVHITTPPQSHLFLTKQSIDAGCHVFVEKPFAMNLPETVEMLSYAEQHNRKVTLGYRTFFDPPALAMRELVRQGVIGEPLHVESHYGYDLSGQFGQAMISDASHWVHKLPGKLFHNIIDHLLNKIVEFIPDEEPALMVHASSLRPQKFGDSRDLLKDELRLMLYGERVTAFGTFSSHIRPVRESLRLYGTKNTAHIDWGMRTVTLEAVGKLPSAIGRLIPPFDMARSYFREGMRNVWKFARSDYHYFAGMHTLIARFYDSILTGGEAPYPYRDIIRVSRLLDEIFSRVEQGHETRAMAVGAGR
jgi:predicted dehydrogenase